MTPTVVAAVRTRARAEIRVEKALIHYRHARSNWYGWYGARRPERREEAIAARTRWTTLYELLAADGVAG